MLISSFFYRSKILLGTCILLGHTTMASGAEQLPEPFSEYGWLVEGMRKVASNEVEFAPVTSCYDLNEKFSGDSTTSIQKKREWDNYKGKYIPLTGILQEVKEIPFSNDYLAYFKCANSSSMFVDFTMRVPGDLEDYAFSLSPNERHTVYVKLTSYGEMTGVSTELDVITIDTGDGETCPAKFSHLDRKEDKYQYICGDSDVVLSREVSNSGDYYFNGWSELESRGISVILPYPGGRNYVLIRSEGKLIYHGGHGDDCYSSLDAMKRLEQEDDTEIFHEALSEIKVSLKNKGIEFDSNNIVEINTEISLLDENKFSCDLKQVLRHGLLAEHMQ